MSFLCETFAETLARHKTPVDGVFHGTFGTGDLAPGELTVADCWTIIPYENVLATAELTARDLFTIVAEDAGDRKSPPQQNLWVNSGSGNRPRT